LKTGSEIWQMLKNHSHSFWKKFQFSIRKRRCCQFFANTKCLHQGKQSFLWTESISIFLFYSAKIKPCYDCIYRAVWYIKMSAAYSFAMSETNKTKKRSAPDMCIEWTQTLIKFLKEQLQEYISLSLSSQSSSAVLTG